MFAVPGWAVSQDSLVTETISAPDPGSHDSHPSKKRKRQNEAINVTSSNVSDLWEKVIEGREDKRPKTNQPNAEGRVSKKGTMPDGAPRLTLKQKKKLKAQKDREANQALVSHGSQQPAEPQLQALHEEDASENKKKRKKSEKPRNSQEDDSAPLAKAQEKNSSAPQAPKLTPMQTAMREKLVSARFRHLNETLYTKPSAEAFHLFQDSPEMFQEYHEGFRRQVNVWPENPVDGFIEDIKHRGRQKPPNRSKPGQSAPTFTSGSLPLVRSNGLCTIADLGCGDAKLATTLQADKKKLNLKILSYDLQSPSPLVTKADIANLPLEAGSVNVVIFCLALMGTNWLDFIEEAYRILHWKGELWIAEIKSRLGHVSNKNRKAPVKHSVGNRKKNAALKSKGKDTEQEENDGLALAIDVDGNEDRRQETDVTAFVEALRRRGFVLQGSGNEAVDLGNKMFVKMHFIKAAQPVIGKGVIETQDSERRGGKKPNAKFVDSEERESIDESKILKPSLYRVR
ncbi:methyltransferase-domain-containing protein [Xylariaceae sp. FL1019]|nr:methyltransferase-domain-containing protein [Xylariaceae sp. FL1019]